jgi:hypothetical protein
MFSFDFYITEDNSVELFYTEIDLEEAAEKVFGEDYDESDLDGRELNEIPKLVELAQDSAIDEYKGY